ncbi:hypothetical protein C8R43DRAFT_1137336 [Mycena crocata]|nr:hypothetical protein C8R43DRAFT_1137336 [Mycena crocata]
MSAQNNPPPDAPVSVPAVPVPAPSVPTPSILPAPKMKQKPGNKGDFHGQRLTFLLSCLPDYMDASKRGKTRDFWAPMFEKYWTMFPWRLALTEEPADGEAGVSNEELSREDCARKEKTVKETKEVENQDVV